MREGGKRFSIIYILSGIAFVVTVAVLVIFRLRVNEIIKSTQPAYPYKAHYAFICKNSSDSFYKEVYEAACEEGEKLDCGVEFMGRDLSMDYSRNDLMKIAIRAKVDGIIVEADESSEIVSLINEAVDKGIPVVTVGSDSTLSSRQSFVGAGFYTLGQMYGEKILEDAPEGEQINVLVLVSPNESDSNQNIIFSGIQDTLSRSGRGEDFSIRTEAVNGKEPFEAEESISELIRNTNRLPEVIVCLDELNTSCMYQALINYNRVGETLVYGYYMDDTILSAVEKNVIAATAVIDTGEMGRYSVDTLNEYISDGMVNEYLPVDIRLIDSTNAREYRTEE